MKVKKLIAFFKEEDGLELSEYAVMGALVVAVTVAVITSLGDAIALRFGALETAVTP